MFETMDEGFLVDTSEQKLVDLSDGQSGVTSEGQFGATFEVLVRPGSLELFHFWWWHDINQCFYWDCEELPIIDSCWNHWTIGRFRVKRIVPGLPLHGY